MIFGRDVITFEPTYTQAIGGKGNFSSNMLMTY